jgi:predicted 3-demethylubiquinone-9 3-methyltransferase (glyoxalase superfamily)
MKRITPCLWFDTQAEEAAKFYVSVFGNGSRITDITPGPGGKPLSVAFELDGRPFVALNGGPLFKFTEATSFMIHCEDQREIDHYWSRLAEGGEESRCGWLKDRYGLSWQVVPKGLSTLLRSAAAMQAMLKMKKLDIAALKAAA